MLAGEQAIRETYVGARSFDGSISTVRHPHGCFGEVVFESKENRNLNVVACSIFLSRNSSRRFASCEHPQLHCEDHRVKKL